MLSGFSMRWSILVLLIFLSGCYKNHLYVQQEWIDENFLASNKIGTPDPRKEHPPKGQRLLVAWDFPRSIFEEGLRFLITVRFWDNTETSRCYIPERKRDSTAFFFPCIEKNERILTYRVQVLTKEGEIIETWNHQFWRDLIQVGGCK